MPLFDPGAADLLLSQLGIGAASTSRARLPSRERDTGKCVLKLLGRDAELSV
ncbi:MAG TPA: hypothetical protein VJR89_03435 [Polyangiales bacterium]|nr:hypothetical protein [Polyangiales bacterium]